MPSTNLQLNEGEVVKMVLEFLQNRCLNISMLSVERETGIINGVFSDDMLFLRQLILDGQWDDVLDFIQPISMMESFNMKQFQYVIMKHKFLELLCIKQEPGPMQNNEFTVDEVVKCLSSMEELAPTKEEYSNMCLLLTLPRLSDHAEYHDWNPSNARVECFKDVCPLVEKFLPIDRRDKRSEDRMSMSKSDRLMQLIIKGILYESCVDYCQHKATSSEYDCKDMKLSGVLNGTGFSDADLSLLSWLQAIPHGTFACPFEQKSLKVDVKALEKPSLEASWSEQLLVTPIKPKIFPHSAIPSSRPRSAELMSRSLMPQYDGLAYGLALGRQDSFGSISELNLMSRSFAGFHLNTGRKHIMATSVDKLFEEGDVIDTQSSIIIEDGSLSQSTHTPKSSKGTPPSSPKLQRTSTPMDTKVTNSQGRGESPKPPPKEDPQKSQVRDSTAELYKEYQKQRAKVQEELAEKDKKRLQLQRQLLEESDTDNRLIESSMAGSPRTKKIDDVINDSPSKFY